MQWERFTLVVFNVITGADDPALLININKSMRLSAKRNGLIIVITACSIILIYQGYFTSNDLQLQNSPSYYKENCPQSEIFRDMKYILLWTSPETEPMVFWGRGQKEFVKRKCKVNKCYLTPDRSFLPCVSEFDAVAFHGPEITNYIAGPRIRSPHQKYVYVSLESSHYYKICDERYDGYFNWTWTYKLDSDEIYGYMRIRNVTGDIIGPNKIMHWLELDMMQPTDNVTKVHLNKKNKAAAWFVSNCDSLSKREKFVEKLQHELRRYGLEIDIFGRCGSKSCPRDKLQECLKMVQEQYYFYLALENSCSKDYVTEKLLTALQNYAVPIVFGAANYTRYMPDGIYLHGGEMAPAELAKVMNDIVNDKDRYYSFFKWRNHYSYHNESESPDYDSQCRMCEMLHNQAIMQKETVYSDFRRWWNVPGACYGAG